MALHCALGQEFRSTNTAHQPVIEALRLIGRYARAGNLTYYPAGRPPRPTAGPPGSGRTWCTGRTSTAAAGHSLQCVVVTPASSMRDDASKRSGAVALRVRRFVEPVTPGTRSFEDSDVPLAPLGVSVFPRPRAPPAAAIMPYDRPVVRKRAISPS